METIVLRTRGNETLLKITGTYEAGGKTYDGTRFEWWRDNEKMDQGITSEELNGELYIYCKGFSGMTDDQAIGVFEAGAYLTGSYKLGGILMDNKPNIGILMVRVHNAVTRGLDVSIERSDYFIKNGYPDAAAQDAFITYARTLGIIINAHHLSEDNVVFPYLKAKLPEAPFEKLSADHKTMDPVLKEIQTAVNQMAVQPQGGDPLKNLNSAVKRLSELWRPHIAIELFHIYDPKKTDDLMSADEQLKLMAGASQYSLKEGDPGLLIPFILYNLEAEERAYVEHTLPASFLKELIPVVWKNKWEPMKPFMIQ